MTAARIGTGFDPVHPFTQILTDKAYILNHSKERSIPIAYAHTNSKGNTYYLHSKETTLRNGRKQTLYFFAKEVKDGSLDAVPEGYEVSESKNGLPVLKRSR